MAKIRKSAAQTGPQKRSKRVSLAYLDKLISEATVDCYNVKGSSLRLTLIEVVYDFLDALLHLPVSLHLSFHPAYRAARRAISIHPK